MKGKKLIVILSILVFLTVLIVLNSTLFTLQTINVNWLTTKYKLQTVKDYDLIGDISKGESIFLVNKDEIKSELEKKYSYLKVVSIETKFPNKIVVHSAERESLYAIKLADNEYVILDEEGKVLDFANDSIFAQQDLGAKPIKVFFENVAYKSEDFAKGEMVKIPVIEKMLSQLSYSLRESNYNPTNSKGIFTSITATANGESLEVTLSTRVGIQITLKDAQEYTTNKLLLGLNRYNYFHQEGVVSGTVEVWYSSIDDKIIARYVA